MSEIEFMFATLLPFILFGVVAGVTLGVIGAFIKAALKLYPLIVILALVIYWREIFAFLTSGSI